MKRILSIIAAALAVCTFLVAMLGCSSAPAALKYNNTVITTNMYQFYISRYKAQILSSYNSGQDNAGFWDQVLDKETGASVATFFEDMAVESVKIKTLCVGLFEEYGLKLADDVYDSIDDEIAELIDEYGSRAELNLAASAYGVNDKMLRDIYIMDAKIKAVYSYLYGEGGIDAITEENRETYYRDNYVHIKTIFVNTSYNTFEDEEGNLIYDESTGYLKTEDKSEDEIAAAKEKGEQLKALLSSGEKFEDLIDEYTDDPANEYYKDGFFFTQNSSYYGNVLEVAFELEENEWGVAESEYGLHFVLRLPLTDEAYKNKDYEEFFSDLDDAIANEKFDKKINELLPKVIAYEDEIKKYSLKDIEQNQEF